MRSEFTSEKVRVFAVVCGIAVLACCTATSESPNEGSSDAHEQAVDINHSQQDADVSSLPNGGSSDAHEQAVDVEHSQQDADASPEQFLGAFPPGTTFRTAGTTCPVVESRICDDGTTAACSTNADCADGEVCVSPIMAGCECRPIGCFDDTDCGPGSVCLCAHPNSDSSPCGEEISPCVATCTPGCRSDDECAGEDRCATIFGQYGPVGHFCVGPMTPVPDASGSCLGSTYYLVRNQPLSAVCIRL
jgi:hypothetical protein